ncbi:MULTISPECIES: hypothetical protein [Micrococcaceae]|uniref:hypothetical protein n=1 Tax=Micrococcaceae TaxID=1268 RepID=UPI001414FFE5|nr:MULTISPECIES: hypothetical protein [unclassified Arthrobacter]
MELAQTGSAKHLTSPAQQLVAQPGSGCRGTTSSLDHAVTHEIAAQAMELQE